MRINFQKRCGASAQKKDVEAGFRLKKKYNERIGLRYLSLLHFHVNFNVDFFIKKST